MGVFTLPTGIVFSNPAVVPNIVPQTVPGPPGPPGPAGPPGLPGVALPGGSTSPATGLNNVLSYAAGIPIGDGTLHTVSSAPLGTPFNGVTTIAGIAAININGSFPFSWITSAPFTGLAYNFTDADAPNLDIAWLAIQAALITQKCYVPAGIYIVGSKRNLPLYVPPASETNSTLNSGIMIQGDGARISIIKAGSDFGAGVPLIACGDPAGTRANGLGRYAPGAEFSGDMEKIGFFPSIANLLPAIGTTPIAMTGMALGARLRTRNVEASGMGKCWNFIGDHTKHYSPRAFGGTIGAYWDNPHSVLEGDITFDDFMFSGQSQASIAVHGLARIEGVIFSGETYLSAPYGILGEAGTQDILNGCEFDYLFTEFMGNAQVADDSGFSGGVYTDANKKRGVRDTTFRKLFNVWSPGNFWGSTGRARRATWDVDQVGIHVIHLSMDGGQFAPVQAPSGSAPIATFNVRQPFYGGVCGTQISGMISTWQSQSGALPLFSSGTVAGNPLLTQT